MVQWLPIFEAIKYAIIGRPYIGRTHWSHVAILTMFSRCCSRVQRCESKVFCWHLTSLLSMCRVRTVKSVPMGIYLLRSFGSTGSKRCREQTKGRISREKQQTTRCVVSVVSMKSMGLEQTARQLRMLPCKCLKRHCMQVPRADHR